MKKSLIILTLLFCFGNSNLKAQCELNLDFSKLTLEYSDEFNNNSMTDHISRWDTMFSWGNILRSENYYWEDMYSCYRDQTHSISNGVLNLKITKASTPIPNSYTIPTSPAPSTYRPSYSNYYVSAGMIRSRYNDGSGNPSATGFTYGIIEARFKMPRTAGLYPCLWLCSSTNAAYAMAMRENYISSTDNDFIAYAQYPSGSTTASCPTNSNVTFPYGLDDSYHTYTLVWAPSGISWFFDGREYWSIATPAAYQGPPSGLKMDLIFNMDYLHWCQRIVGRDTTYVECDDNNPSDLPFNAEQASIDYIRIYKPTNGWTNFNYTSGGYHSNVSNTGASSVANSNISMASTGPGQVFYKGTDSRVWNIYWANNQWNTVPLSWSAPQDVASDVYDDNGNNRIYYRTSTGLLKWYVWNSGTSSYTITTDNQVQNMSGWLDIDQSLHKAYYKGNDGKLWQYYNNGSGYAASPLSSVNNIYDWVKVSPDGNYIYYRSSDNYLWCFHWNGTSWINQQLPIANNVAGDLAIQSGTRVYYRATDGRVWNWDGSGTQYIAPLTWDLSNCAGNIVYNNNGVFYRGTDQKLWHLSWIHDQWYYETVNWNQANVAGAIATSPSGQLFYIGTPVSGSVNTLWQSQPGSCTNYTTPCSNGTAEAFYKTLDTTATSIRNINTNNSGSLSVFPNPSNQVFEFSLQLESPTKVSLNIYDLSGRLVGNVSDQEYRQQGFNQFRFDAANLSSGNYLYELKSNNQVYNGRIVKY